MSVDYTLVCNTCKQYHHLGQWMGARHPFGYGTGDVEMHQRIGEFILSHLFCLTELRVVGTDAIPEDCVDAEERYGTDSGEPDQLLGGADTAR